MLKREKRGSVTNPTSQRPSAPALPWGTPGHCPRQAVRAWSCETPGQQQGGQGGKRLWHIHSQSLFLPLLQYVTISRVTVAPTGLLQNAQSLRGEGKGSGSQQSVGRDPSDIFLVSTQPSSAQNFWLKRDTQAVPLAQFSIC